MFFYVIWCFGVLVAYLYFLKRKYFCYRISVSLYLQYPFLNMHFPLHFGCQTV